VSTDGAGVTDARLAAEIAASAGDLLLEIRRSGLEGKELGQAGDRRSNELILARLAAARPDDAVLSEESADSPARLSASRVWIVDPLDGTREYGMEGRSDWAVHVALWDVASGSLSAAAVAQPALDVVYATDSVAPALEGVSSGSDRPAPAAPVVLVSDSRPPAFAPAVADAIGGSVVTMGSAGAKTMAVVRGDAAAYLHAGGQWEWDSAAPVGVARAAGLHASRIDGRALVYNSAHPYLPDLLVCRADLAEPMLAALRGHI
jgi:3'(2'), 5'-bisphosphate nucleotidase